MVWLLDVLIGTWSSLSCLCSPNASRGFMFTVAGWMHHHHHHHHDLYISFANIRRNHEGCFYRLNSAAWATTDCQQTITSVWYAPHHPPSYAVICDLLLITALGVCKQIHHMAGSRQPQQYGLCEDAPKIRTLNERKGNASLMTHRGANKQTPPSKKKKI